LCLLERDNSLQVGGSPPLILIKLVELIEILYFRQGLEADNCPTRSIRK